MKNLLWRVLEIYDSVTNMQCTMFHQHDAVTGDKKAFSRTKTANKLVEIWERWNPKMI